MKKGTQKSKKFMLQVKKRYSSLSKTYKLLAFVLLFATVGVTLLIITRAGSPNAVFEAESATLSSNAKTVSDSTASGGSAIQFNGAPPVATNKLKWAPPSGYANYTVKNVTSSSSLTSIDGGGGNVFIKLSKTGPVGPITIQNCNNAVIIGGQINLLPQYKVNGADQRGIYVKNCTGTVFIEGVYINGDITNAQGDGIAIDSDLATVVVQNVRVYKLYGGSDKALYNHSDIIQPWGGVKALLVDRLTGSSNYQGFQINNDMGPIGSAEINNVNIGDSGVPPPDGKGGYFLWPKCGAGTKYTFNNFYLQPRSGRTLSNSIWDGGCGLSVSNNIASFSSTDVTGTVKGGKPSVDFVPDGVAGLNYVSPGYQ